MDNEQINMEPEEQKPEPKPRKPKRESYKNIANCTVMVMGQPVQKGESYTLTADDRKDKYAMKRLERAVELGLLEKA